ncbi:uncharacterized protein METZ01_LOCUS204923 [marine metagenome]|uniref:Uncharacterized protein n=1 Tax=marine metagenome TaxID=408172 RepID=A0A382ENX5_9ZZZZ
MTEGPDHEPAINQISGPEAVSEYLLRPAWDIEEYRRA